MSSQERYYACNDPNRPVCKNFVKHGNCKKNNKCHYYHPRVITPSLKQDAKRKVGYCFCKAPLRTIISTKNPGTFEYFIICSRTNRSMKRCKVQLG